MGTGTAPLHRCTVRQCGDRPTLNTGPRHWSKIRKYDALNNTQTSLNNTETSFYKIKFFIVNIVDLHILVGLINFKLLREFVVKLGLKCNAWYRNSTILV